MFNSITKIQIKYAFLFPEYLLRIQNVLFIFNVGSFALFPFLVCVVYYIIVVVYSVVGKYLPSSGQKEKIQKRSSSN